jgi:hypothetical protein
MLLHRFALLRGVLLVCFDRLFQPLDMQTRDDLLDIQGLLQRGEVPVIAFCSSVWVLNGEARLAEGARRLRPASA